MIETVKSALPAVWTLEDSPEIIRVFDLLLRQRYELRLFETLGELEAAMGESGPNPALLVADLILPDGMFLDFMTGPVWQRRPLFPLLVASGVTDIESMREALDRGAHDYITKPFVGNELLVKVERAIATRTGAKINPADAVVKLDQFTRCVTHAGRTSQPLTSREMQILFAMREDYNHPVKRTDIIQKVWGTTKVTSKCLDVHLSHLRQKVLEVGLEIRLLTGGSYQLQPRKEDAA